MNPRFWRWFMSICNQQIANIKDQIARSSIANRDLLPGAETIEVRNSNAKQRDAKTLGRLPSMRMRHEQIGSCGAQFEILQVAQQDLVNWNAFKNW
jgi:hypothetical protein